MSAPRKGFVISAPSSGAGKTTVTLGLLAALRASGTDIASAKSGPDYIDPAFHAAATGQPCITLDPWCASPDQLRARAAASAAPFLVVEGAMGLFDGAPSDSPMGHGSTADVAEALTLPVILVIDAARRAQTAAAIVHGLASFRPNVEIAGVILNRIGSERHESMMRRAVETVAPVLGSIPRSGTLTVPSRHLGLQQASELQDLDDLLSSLGETVTEHCDLDAIRAVAAPVAEGGGAPNRLTPLGQRIAVARDEAFGFSYPHMLDDWRAQGAEISLFSPLANEAPPTDADAIFLPGGYPELYGGRLAAADTFRAGMIAAKNRDALIYGECGGFMMLGSGLIDGYDQRHEMLGFLNVETSFAKRKLSLGYRDLTPLTNLPWSGPLKGHEFHYSTITRSEGTPLFDAAPAAGSAVPIGLRKGRVMGSYAHVVEIRASNPAIKR